ncbi:hypothetical protein JHK85_054908 [Glycine max]|nr:hypothetical protein JHK86_053952 [Glycine max]KAG4928422.1 hypothetical protein JHK85_054908 [Glycine max]
MDIGFFATCRNTSVDLVMPSNCSAIEAATRIHFAIIILTSESVDLVIGSNLDQVYPTRSYEINQQISYEVVLLLRHRTAQGTISPLLLVFSSEMTNVECSCKVANKSHLPRIFGTVLAVLFIGFVAWGYQAIQPPASKICGSPNGSTITAPRIKLRDGRNLAYKEHGVPKDVAKHKIIFVHGFDACRHDAYVSKTLSPVIVLYL